MPFSVLSSKFNVRIALAIVLLLAACSTSRPPRPPAPPPPVPGVQTAALHVGVRDARTGAPIADARIDVSAIAGEDDGRSSMTGYWGVQLPILGVPTDGYRLEVHADGYQSFGADVGFAVETEVIARLEPLAPPAPPITMPWHGQLRVAPNERGFIDADGHWQLPVLAHFGEAFSAYVRRPAEVEAQLVAIKQAGYDGIRFWDHLGEYSVAWRGKEVAPWSWTNGDGIRVEATPDYYGRLQVFLELLKRLGLTAHHSRGDLGRHQPAIASAQVVAHTQRVAAIYDAIGWDVLALFEANNENFQNGNYSVDQLRAFVRPARDRGAITASSCPGACTEEPEDVQSHSAGFSVRYYHGYRNGDATDRIRHIFTTSYEQPEHTPRLAWEGEPTGPNEFPGLGVTVGNTEDVEELGLLAVQRLLTRGAWTYMSQYGVFWNGRIDRHKGFFVVPRMRAALAAAAADVMTWPTLRHGGRSDAAWCAPAGCRGGNYYGDPGITSGPARIDQAIRGDRRQAVALVHGGRPPFVVRNVMGCTATVQVVHPRDDETVDVDEALVPAGAVFELPPYRVGRLLLARCQ